MRVVDFVNTIRKYNCISCGGSGFVNIIKKKSNVKNVKEMDL
jgi:hypothetical protein